MTERTRVWGWIRPAITYSLLAALLYVALRNAPLTEIWEILRKLQPWQVFLLVILNTAIYILITLRWWLIIRAEKKGVPLVELFSTRLSVFGISYFTLKADADIPVLVEHSKLSLLDSFQAHA